MKFTEVPEGSKFLDVDGIAVVTLPDGECIAFAPGVEESRPYPNPHKAGMEGDAVTREAFAAWLSTGVSPFAVR